MRTYFCYIHSRGERTPTMKVVEARDNSDALHVLVDCIGSASRLSSVELLELYDENQKSLCRMQIEARDFFSNSDSSPTTGARPASDNSIDP